MSNSKEQRGGKVLSRLTAGSSIFDPPVHSVTVTDVDSHDYPELSDARIESAKWDWNGLPLTEFELQVLNDWFPEFVNREAHELLVCMAEAQADAEQGR